MQSTLLINLMAFLYIQRLFKKYQTWIDDFKSKVVTFKLENQIFWMLLSLFTFFEVILFMGDLEGITAFIVGTISITFVAFTIFMGWQIVNLIQIFSTRQKIASDIEQNKQLDTYLTNIQAQYDDLRRFKHDFKNVILSMNMQTADANEQYEELYNELVKRNEFTTDLDGKIVADYQKITSEPLRGLIIQKFFKAKSNGIKLNVEITDEMIDIDADILDIVRIVGILLDNAIEETIQGNTKVIDLAFIKEADSLEISLENPLNHELKIKDIFQRGYSTKGNNRGIGLANVTELIEKNPDLYLDTEIIDQKLRITLIILERE